MNRKTTTLTLPVDAEGQVLVEPDPEKIYEEFLRNDWGDGLPIIPPTRDRVDRMLEFTDRKPDESLGRIPPMDNEAFIETIAVNAVMAGCLPAYMPVVISAVKGICHPDFGYHGMATSTGGASVVHPSNLFDNIIRSIRRQSPALLCYVLHSYFFPFIIPFHFLS